MAIKNSWASGEVLTAADLTDTFKGVFINAQSGTTYTIGTADSFVSISNASGGTVTIPTNATAAFNTGAVVGIMNAGTAGTFTIAGAGGVTVNTTTGGTTLLPLETVYVVKLGTNTWQTKRDPGIANAGGLAFITSSTFSASTAINVNNCLSSTYQNYMITMHMTTGATGFSSFRLRVGGVDASGSDYNQQRSGVGGTTYTGTRSASQSLWFGHGYVTTLNYLLITLFRPNEAAPTAGIAQMGRGTDTAIDMDDFRLGHTLSTAYDGFTMGFGSNATGTLRVYGYRNS